MAMFDEKTRNQLIAILETMNSDVSMLYFTQEIECDSCRDMHAFVDEMAGLSEKLKLTLYDFLKDKPKAEEYSVDKIPAIVLLDKDDLDTGIKFYGPPGGYEINSFVRSVIEVSGRKDPLPPKIAERIAKIDKDVHIQVFVSLT